jgi:hypothetical protein
MRTISKGTRKITKVIVEDEKGEGGAYHKYKIVHVGNESINYANIKFQKGSVKESDINGCYIEDLLIIVQDRLECFQNGDFPCLENELALSCVSQALNWLNYRTKERQKRGVEGLSKL